MASKVQQTPVLPKPPSTGDTAGLYGYLGFLNKTLYILLANLGVRANVALPEDGTEAMTAPLTLASYTVAGVPAAGTYEGAIIYVSNETGGKTIAFSDGTNWRRVQDRAIIA